MSTRLILLAWLLPALAACAPPPAPDDVVDTDAAADPVADGLGVDDGVIERCLSCHAAVVGDAWAQTNNSHHALLDCDACHHIGEDIPHATTPELPTCDGCHSEVAHQGLPCTSCHNPHGSANAFLIRTQVMTPDGDVVDIHLTASEGATPDGLARYGVEGSTPGTGLCEVCHTTTIVARADGAGVPHTPDYCTDCHNHQQGFDATVETTTRR